MSKRTEQLLILACLKHASVMVPNRHGLGAEHFSHYAREWRWMTKWAQQHRQVPSEELFRSQHPKFPRVVADDVPDAIDHLTVKLHEEWTADQLGDLARDVVERLNSDEAPSSVVLSVQRATEDMKFTGPSRESEIVNEWSSLFDDLRAEESRRQQYGRPSVPTGIITIDEVSGGLRGGDYWVVAGRLGEGKTWCLVSMACHAAVAGNTVQFVTLEQPRSQISVRCLPVLAHLTGYDVPITGIQRSDIIEIKRAHEHVEESVEGRLFINDVPKGSVSIASIRAQIERNEPDVVFVDYLTLLSPRGADWQAVAEVSGHLKDLAMDYNLPVVVAAQINRSGVTEGLPDAHHLAGSDAIGQDADGVVTMLHRPKESRTMRMRLAKYRHGGDGQEWWMHFDPTCGVFEEISGDEAELIRKAEIG